jgi:hypothetical protein
MTENAGDSETPPPAWKSALLMWLRWNDAYERLTSELFKTNQPRESEELLDQLDEIRAMAVRLSRQALEEGGRSST